MNTCMSASASLQSPPSRALDQVQRSVLHFLEIKFNIFFVMSGMCNVWKRLLLLLLLLLLPIIIIIMIVK